MIFETQDDFREAKHSKKVSLEFFKNHGCTLDELIEAFGDKTEYDGNELADFLGY